MDSNVWGYESMSLHDALMREKKKLREKNGPPVFEWYEMLPLNLSNR